MRLALRCAASTCAAALLFAAQSTAVLVTLTPREIVAARVAAALTDNAQRGAKLRDMFEQAGCPAGQLQLQPVKRVKAPNVICTLPGETDRVIVVGAHFDHAERGLGVIDDWSGASLLPSLLECLRTTARRHTFVFIGFTGEERGLLGAYSYVGQIGKEGLRKIAAMIDFDSIGAGPTEVERATADKQLLGRLLNVTGTLKLPLTYVDVFRVGSSDFAVFRAKKVPTLLFHSITQDTLGLLHSTRDNLQALKMDDYYNTYRIAAIYLAYLDRTLDAPGQPTPESPPAPSLLRATEAGKK